MGRLLPSELAIHGTHCLCAFFCCFAASAQLYQTHMHQFHMVMMCSQRHICMYPPRTTHFARCSVPASAANVPCVTCLVPLSLCLQRHMVSCLQAERSSSSSLMASTASCNPCKRLASPTLADLAHTGTQTVSATQKLAADPSRLYRQHADSCHAQQHSSHHKLHAPVTAATAQSSSSLDRSPGSETSGGCAAGHQFQRSELAAPLTCMTAAAQWQYTMGQGI